jgi:cation-transporting ATPase E
MKEILTIIRRNFMQPIVVAILVLAAALLILGERRDAWFVSFVIIVNTLFAIIQELRARRALRKLELMSAPRARRINDDGTVSDIRYTELLVDDRIDIRSGDEIPADGRIISSRGLEVNESMLTGESTSILKGADTLVYASSSVVAGSAIVVVTAIGSDTRVGDMTKTLKQYAPQSTPLQRSIAFIIAMMTYGALALAALIFVVYFTLGKDPVVIVKTITSAAVTVVPEGLLLASTLLLAFGSLRLAAAKVLPQKLAAIEAMALLDTLCVDKTGTLTSDTIQFSKLELWEGAPKYADELLGIAALETSSGNATGDAMIAGLPQAEGYVVKDRLAFSSERKYSGVRVSYRHTTSTVLIGAPEFLGNIGAPTRQQKEQIKEYTERGQRVLLAVLAVDQKKSLSSLGAGDGRAIGIIILSNELRRGVTKTIHYLQSNGVSVKVISGDSPDTVRYVAAEAGIKNTEHVITGAELADLTDKAWEKAADNHVIFSRVLPEQKEQLIAHFKDSGHFTGMVGDGVNDALALKKADLGVAMFAGAAATRRIADIVLLNNSFNSLPLGMRLGNRIMLAIEMIATLFFHKIIYGIVLLFTTLFLGIVYPFAPRHVTFMNIFLVTLPTILWTLFSPIPSYKISPKRFWWDTLAPVAPIAIISGVVVALSYLRLLATHPDDPEGVATTTVLIATFFGVYLVFLMGKMFRAINNRTAKLARVLYILAVLFVVIISFGFGFTREFFDFTVPALQQSWPLLLMIGFAVLLQWLVADRVARAKKVMNRRIAVKK